MCERKDSFIAFFAAMCMVYAFPALAQKAVTVTSVPGNPWSYNSELIFRQGAKEIARRRTDNWGNITYISGTVPDGLAKGYFPDSKLMMEIPFKHNQAEGVGHSFYEDGALASDDAYKGGILNGIQTGYYPNGKIKTQGEWRDGKPVGLHKVFDEQGRLEMTEIKETIRTETRFYSGERKKSVCTYRDDKLIEASEYGEDGALRVHATKYATLNECRVTTDKSIYGSGDAVGFSLACRCEGAQGCFSPALDTRGFLHSGWTEHLVIERDGTQYQAVFCPMCAQARFDNYSKYLFKDGEQIAHELYPSQEPPNGSGTRWVDRTAYAACSEHWECNIKVFDRGIASLPSGDYTAWLDAGSKPEKISFTIESRK